MNDRGKISAAHLRRTAMVYIRQSTATQVEHNRESTARQYALADRAVELGWLRGQVAVIDQDLGLSGASAADRSGFAQLTAEVALGHVGIVLGLEVSRLARNNADWYRLLDLCGMTDTLIGDADGVYHPGLFNDRLLLGLKGTMSEAELHILRARLDGGIRNKAARGELRRGLPVGFVWGDEDGEVRLHPDAAVVAAIRSVFERFAELGSARRVWLWFHAEGLSFPHRPKPGRRNPLVVAHLCRDPPSPDQSGVCRCLLLWENPQ
jgi:DNA invertase Pin-like site-specific DNA recombinase